MGSNYTAMMLGRVGNLYLAVRGRELYDRASVIEHLDALTLIPLLSRMAVAGVLKAMRTDTWRSCGYREDRKFWVPLDSEVVSGYERVPQIW